MTEDERERFTVTEYTGLLNLISGMLTAMEARILDRLSDNSRMASERWARHDEDSRRIVAEWERRFVVLETSVHEHHHAAEIEHIAWDARLGPVRNTLALIARNWKTIALALFALLGFLAVFLDIVARYLGLES